jgi:hypothetical protein
VIVPLLMVIVPPASPTLPPMPAPDSPAVASRLPVPPMTSVEPSGAR